MANNCLVTKLKGTVINDSLPILNTIRIDLQGAVRLGNLETLLIATGDSPVTINSIIPFHVGTTSEAIYHYTLEANVLQNFTFVKDEIPTTYVADAITISGSGIYNLKALIYYLNCGWFKIKDNSSLQYSAGIVSQTYTPEEKVLNTVKIITVDDMCGVNDTRDYSYMFQSLNQNLKILWGLQIDNNTSRPIIDKKFFINTPNLEHLQFRFSGNLYDLPINIKVIYCPSSLTTGSLEEFVANRRLNGKTSGILAFYNPQFTWTVTYQGTAIKDLNTVIRPIISNYSYFAWDASSMGFASSVPTGFKVYDSLFSATRDAIDGSL